MAAPQVTIVRTGAVSPASLLSALGHAGARARVTNHASMIEHAELLVLPGGANVGATMQRLTDCGLVELLAGRIAAGGPTLAIGIGLHVLTEGSDERADVSGLGAIAGRVERFVGSGRTPHVGWNLVENDAACSLIESGYAYFANSHALRNGPQDWSAAWATHGGRFVAALQRGAVLACQFHPELSGKWGIALLRRWIDACTAARASSNAGELFNAERLN